MSLSSNSQPPDRKLWAGYQF